MNVHAEKNVPLSAGVNPGRRLALWLIVWILLYAASLLVYNWSYEATRVVLIHHLQIRPAAVLLNLTLPGEEVRVEGESLYSGRLRLNVMRGCDGVEVWLLLVTALAAFPMPRRRRVKSVLWGTLLIFGLNLLRIVSIYHITLRRPDLFDFVHGFLWQSIMLLSAVLFVLSWLGPAPPEDRDHEAAHA